jgi:hypothetical protein
VPYINVFSQTQKRLLHLIGNSFPNLCIADPKDLVDFLNEFIDGRLVPGDEQVLSEFKRRFGGTTKRGAYHNGPQPKRAKSEKLFRYAK